MTTRAQLRKTALGLPEATETGGDQPVFTVAGRQFAALTPDGQVVLQLDEATVRASLRHCTITELPEAGGLPTGVSVPLAELNGMELNNVVFKSWLGQAPEELAERARSAMRGEVPPGPGSLPASIGKPATRALLLAGITTLEQVAQHTDSELLALHGVGPRAVGILRQALQAGGTELTE